MALLMFSIVVRGAIGPPGSPPGALVGMVMRPVVKVTPAVTPATVARSSGLSTTGPTVRESWNVPCCTSSGTTIYAVAFSPSRWLLTMLSE